MDNNLAFLTTSSSFTNNGKKEFLFLKIDTSGAVIKNILISESNKPIDAFDLLQNDDSTYMISGHYNESSTYAGMLIKLDKNGGMIWGKKMKISGDAALWRIQNLKNNKIALYGNAYGLGLGDYDYLLVESDTAFNVSCVKWDPFKPKSNTQTITNKFANSYFSIDNSYNKGSLSWSLTKDTISFNDRYNFFQ